MNRTYALQANTIGQGNVALGRNSLGSNTTGNTNVGIGVNALSLNTTGNNNSAFGYGVLRGTVSAVDNTAVGHASMIYVLHGNRNVAVGTDTLQGPLAFPFTAVPSGSVAIGYRALYANNTGVYNVAVGARALVGTTSGTNNTAVGYGAGTAVTTGTNLTIIGYLAAASSATATNEVTLGNSSVATLRCQVTTITALSDFRDKTDINNVEVGLSFVEKLRPVTFKWDKREWYTDGNRDGSKKDSIIQAGFIAQELKALQEQEGVEFLKLVYESNPDKLEATPGNLMIPLIKAVQELSAKVKSLETKVQILESK